MDSRSPIGKESRASPVLDEMAQSQKPSKEDPAIRKSMCRYGPGCTHIMDSSHREKFWHPRVLKLNDEQIKSHFICNECGYATNSLPDLQLHLQRKTAWSNLSLVGCRINCLVDMKEWHEGYVTTFHKSGKHFVEFRHLQERRWLVMKKVTFYIIERPPVPHEGSEFKDSGDYEANLAPIEDSWVFCDDISIDYAFAQSVLFKIYGNNLQETGHLTKGHVCVTDVDRLQAQSAKSSLLYGELLPRGANKALGAQRLDAQNAETLFDLGMGTGKILIQAFLQFRNLRYIYGVELSAGRYQLAEDAVLRMVELLGHENYHVHMRQGKFIMVTEAVKIVSSLDENVLNGQEEEEYMERVLHFQCGNMFDLKEIDLADIVMMETDVPSELYPQLQQMLSQMKDNAKILTYFDMQRVFDADREQEYGGFVPFRQMEVNKLLSDRYPTSWSVQRGHHFFLWTKLSLLEPVSSPSPSPWSFSAIVAAASPSTSDSATGGVSFASLKGASSGFSSGNDAVAVTLATSTKDDITTKKSPQTNKNSYSDGGMSPTVTEGRCFPFNFRFFFGGSNSTAHNGNSTSNSIKDNASGGCTTTNNGNHIGKGSSPPATSSSSPLVPTNSEKTSEIVSAIGGDAIGSKDHDNNPMNSGKNPQVINKNRKGEGDDQGNDTISGNKDDFFAAVGLSSSRKKVQRYVGENVVAKTRSGMTTVSPVKVSNPTITMHSKKQQSPNDSNAEPINNIGSGGISKKLIESVSVSMPVTPRLNHSNSSLSLTTGVTGSAFTPLDDETHRDANDNNVSPAKSSSKRNSHKNKRSESLRLKRQSSKRQSPSEEDEYFEEDSAAVAVTASFHSSVVVSTSPTHVPDYDVSLSQKNELGLKHKSKSTLQYDSSIALPMDETAVSFPASAVDAMKKKSKKLSPAKDHIQGDVVTTTSHNLESVSFNPDIRGSMRASPSLSDRELHLLPVQQQQSLSPHNVVLVASNSCNKSPRSPRRAVSNYNVNGHIDSGHSSQQSQSLSLSMALVDETNDADRNFHNSKKRSSSRSKSPRMAQDQPLVIAADIVTTTSNHSLISPGQEDAPQVLGVVSPLKSPDHSGSMEFQEAIKISPRREKSNRKKSNN